MNIRYLMRAVLSALLIVTTTPLHAEMIGTDRMLTQEMRATHLTQVQAFMARDDVRIQLQAQGVDPAMASQRVAALTDSELQRLAQNIQDMPAGGDVLGVILVVLLILVLLELLGAIDIFPRI